MVGNRFRSSSRRSFKRLVLLVMGLGLILLVAILLNFPASHTAAAASGPELPVQAPTATPLLPLSPFQVDGYMSNIYPARLKNIARTGQRLGMRPYVFSKIGDSLTANEFYLIDIGRGRFDLHEHTYFLPVLAFYYHTQLRDGNSFNNTSLGAGQGWTTSELLDPAYADPDFCKAGENPLDCEFRWTQPGVATLLIGTNDMLAGRPVGEYERHLRRVLDYFVKKGVIPIMTTLPPLLTQDRQIHPLLEDYNRVIKKLSREYQLPLMDYFIVAVGLPGYGLWDDGIHPNWRNTADFTDAELKYGVTARNFMTLHALDRVWRGVGWDKTVTPPGPPVTATPTPRP